MILIGSRSLALRCPQILSRKPQDFDWICTEAEYHNWLEKNRNKINPTKMYDLPEFNKKIIEGDVNLEFEIIKEGSSAEMLDKIVRSDPATIESPFGLIPSLNILFSIKDSHKYKKFETTRGCAIFYKTAQDWHRMKQVGACVETNDLKAFVKKREEETYTHKLPKLNMSKENFFDENQNGVHMIYDHDDIHKAVAIGSRPAYLEYLKDNSPVLTSKKKFFEVSEEVRLNGGKEEGLVLSVERSLCAHPGVWKPEYAMLFATAKICSTITGGYFRQFCYENIFKILQTYPKNYWEIFQQAVKDGKVRRLAR